MTLSVRTAILTIGLALATLSVGLSIGAVVLASAEGAPLGRTVQDSDVDDPALPNAVAAGIVGVSALATSFWLHFLFRKTSSGEAFFFLVFVLSICLEGLRPVVLVVVARGLPLAVGLLVSRAVYFGYFLGVLSLFASSLYAMQLRYQKLTTVLAMILASGLLLSYFLALDMTVLRPTLVFRMGRETFFRVIFLIFGFLTTVNFVRSAFQAGSQSGAYIGLSVGLVVVGRELIFVTGFVAATAVGLVAVLVGTALIVRRLYAQSLWL